MSRQNLKWGLVFLSLVVGVAQSAYLLRWFERYSQANENAIAFESKRSEITRLDEVLTMSAVLYAATGELSWRTRYENHVEPLELALEEALALAASDAALRAIDQVRGSNDALIVLEETSLGLAERGRLSEALKLLTSPSYEDHKDSYQQGLSRALEISHGSLRSEVGSDRGRLMLAAFLLVVSLLILSELWRRLSVAEQREAAEQIRASLEREQRTTGLQRQFVSILSHELRTPLAIIDGRAQGLQRRAAKLTQDKIQAHGQSIRDAVKHLTGLMEGVLNVSKIEEGTIDINPEVFDPRAMIEKVVADYREVNGDRQIDLALTELPSSILADPSMLAQVVSNLLSNALKYSDQSRPVRVEGGRQRGDVVIAVHDEGVGIPKGEIDKLGERFFRATSSTGISGTGIGLHFIRHLIDLHDGRLEIESTEGVGSSFAVCLPHRSVTPSLTNTPVSATPALAA